MERNVNYIIVGFFVAFILIGIAGFIMWLSGTHDTREYSRYTVYFDSAVNGLEEGGVVRYRGVNVGRVIDIRLAVDRPDLIKVDIEVIATTPIRIKTKGALKPQGITGLSFIELKTESTDDGPPKTIVGETYPVIEADPSQLDQFFEDAPELTGRLIQLSDRLNSITGKIDLLLDEKNMGNISQTLTNINTASNNLNHILSEENTLSIANTISQINEATSNLVLILNEKNATTVTNLLTRLDSTGKNLEKIVSVVASNEDSLDRFTGEGLSELTYLIHDAREMVTAIKILAETIDEEPSRIIFQPGYDGVKIEK